MKQISVFVFILIGLTSYGQDSWLQKMSVPDTSQTLGVSFAIDGKLYFTMGFAGSGSVCKKMWEYDPATNQWAQKASYPGLGVKEGVGFAVGGKGYVGLGVDSTINAAGDFWEYDPIMDIWTQKSNFIGVPRADAASFVIGNKAYVGAGWSPPNYLKDFYEYDPMTNSWSQINDFGGSARAGALSFCIDEMAYVGAGQGLDSIYSTVFFDFWKYNPLSNSWIPIATHPATNRVYCSFSLGNRAYVGVDHNSADFYEYIPSSNAWASRSSFGGGGRWWFQCTSSNGRGYLFGGCHFDGIMHYYNDLWEYTPEIYITNIGNTSVCAGNSFSLSIIAAPDLSTCCFDIELSDEQGNFNSPTIIGTTCAWPVSNVNCTIPANTISGTSYKVRVSAGTCSSDYISPESMVSLSITGLPAAASSISGNQNVCQGQQNLNYSVPAISGATSYQWMLPSAYIGSSLTNSISIDFSGSAVSDTIFVYGVNSCGIGQGSFFLITVNPSPSPAGPISGNAGVCQGQSIWYSVSTIPNADSYQWSLPTGALGTSDSSSIQVTFSTSAQNGDITVNSVNTCGIGVPSSKAISVTALPSSAGIISGQNEACIYASGVSYSVSPIIGASSYNWTLFSGVTGSSISNSIIVDFGGTATSGSIQVNGVNACGSGSGSSLYIQVNEIVYEERYVSICEGENYMMPDSSIVDSAGLYGFVIENMSGCDTNVSFHLSVNPSPATAIISQWQEMLFSDKPVGNQWYELSTGLLAGETDQSFTPSSAGNYFDIIHLNGCLSDTSNIISYSPSFIHENSLKQNTITVYPNPFRNRIWVHYSQAVNQPLKFEVYGVLGNKLYGRSNCCGDEVMMDLSNLLPGIYILKIFEANSEFVTIRLFKME